MRRAPVIPAQGRNDTRGVAVFFIFRRDLQVMMVCTVYYVVDLTLQDKTGLAICLIFLGPASQIRVEARIRAQMDMLKEMV